MAAKFYNIGYNSISENCKFDMVLVDEAGSAVECEVVSCFVTNLKKNRQIVICGDPNQLGPVVMSQVACQGGLGTSLLERLMARSCYQPHIDAVSGVKTYDTRIITKLVHSYRCHPDIISIPNKLFYDNELVVNISPETIHANNTLLNWEELPCKGFPVIFHGVLGEEEREGNSPSCFNLSEVDQILYYISKLLDIGIHCKDIVIITPYRKQVQKIKYGLELYGKRSNNALLNDIDVGSCEQMQGRERKVVLISTVRSTLDYLDVDMLYNIGFLSNPKRFNVAITRAQAMVIVVGNASVICTDKCWSEFLWYCVDNGAYRGTSLPSRNNGDDSFMGNEERKIEEIIDNTLNEQQITFNREILNLGDESVSSDHSEGDYNGNNNNEEVHISDNDSDLSTISSLDFIETYQMDNFHRNASETRRVSFGISEINGKRGRDDDEEIHYPDTSNNWLSPKRTKNIHVNGRIVQSRYVTGNVHRNKFQYRRKR
jgi:hypothetical protein